MKGSGLSGYSLSIFLAVLATHSAPVYAQLPPQPATEGNNANSTLSPQKAQVREAVERYFHAADSGNPEAVKNVFWPSGRVEGVIAGKMVSWTAAEFADRNFRGQPPANVAAIRRTIEWLDVSGPGAVARVKINIGPTAEYWDYFILFEVAGDWKIGLKAFANPVPK